MEHLVPTVDYYPDRTYIFTFLLSSRVFIPPHDLLARVGQICLEQRQQLEAGSEKAKLKSFSAKIVQLLKEWTEAFPYDFQDEKAMAELKAITHRVTQCDEENGTVKKAIAQMTQQHSPGGPDADCQPHGLSGQAQVPRRPDEDLQPGGL